MNKLIAFLKSASSYGRKLKKSNPVTLIGIICATVLGMICGFVDSGSLPGGTFYSVCLWGLIASCLFVCGMFLFESSRLKISSGIKILISAIWAIISIVWSITFYDVYTFLSIDKILDNTFGLERINMFNTGVILFFISLGIYFSFKKGSNELFSRYLVKAFGKSFLAGIIFFVICIGIVLLSLMMDELFFVYVNFPMEPLLIMVLGFYFVPSVISAFSNENEEEPVLIKILIKYITLVLCILAYVIIYAYILKIVILWQIPSNSVFTILTALFIVSFIESYFCTSYEKDSFLQKIAYGMPFAFIPFLFLQGYAVVVRIVQHGFTPSRYFGLLFIAFEIMYIIIYIAFWIKKKRPDMSVILLIIAGLVVIGGILPGTNGIDFSKNISVFSLKSYIKNKGYEVSYDEYDYHSRNASAYSYLNKNMNEEQLGNIFSHDDLQILSEIKSKLEEKGINKSKIRAERRVRYINWNKNTFIDFDISDYKSMQTFMVGEYSSDNRDINATSIDISSLHIKMSEDEKDIMVFDFEKYLSDIITEHAKIVSEEEDVFKEDDLFATAFEKKRCLNISENIDLYLTNLYIIYDIDTKEVMSVSMDGIVFRK